jgi:hypothetical protein
MPTTLIRRATLVALALGVVAIAGCAKPKPAAIPAPAPEASVTPTSSVVTSSTTTSGTGAASDSVPAPESPGITVGAPKPVAPGTTRPTDAAVTAVAIKLAKEAGEVDTVKSTKVLGVTQDGAKNWWAYVDIAYTVGGNDGDQQFILKQTGKSWDIIANGTGLTYEDMPTDVRF